MALQEKNNSTKLPRDEKAEKLMDIKIPEVQPARAQKIAEVVHKKEEFKKQAAKKITEMPDVLKTNLIKNNNIENKSQTGIGIALVASFIALILAFIVIFSGMSFVDNKMQDVNSKLATAQKDLEMFSKKNALRETSECKDALAFKEKLDSAEQIVSKHVYWSKFFDKLEELTLDNVKFVGFSGDVSGSYNIAGMAPNFNTIARQIEVGKQVTDVVNIGASGGNLSGAGVNFVLNLSVNPEIFYKK